MNRIPINCSTFNSSFLTVHITIFFMSSELQVLIYEFLISTEDVSCIDLFLYIVQDCVVSISDNCLTLRLELLYVINHLAAKEGSSVFKSRLVDDDLSSLCLDALHHSLDGTLSEVVATCLHC